MDESSVLMRPQVLRPGVRAPTRLPLATPQARSSTPKLAYPFLSTSIPSISGKALN